MPLQYCYKYMWRADAGALGCWSTWMLEQDRGGGLEEEAQLVMTSSRVAHCGGNLQHGYSSDAERESPDAIFPPEVNVDESKLMLDTEVAIIGNGPASILLSFILSGHWPYFTGDHPNPYLKAKLTENMERSILEQDLEYLSEGLEGYSSNPVALLLDTLLRPNSDIGEDHPSSLCWKYDPTRAVPHEVIGRGNPGGSWQYMNPDTLTLSLGKMLELPQYSFRDWLSESTKATECHVIMTNGEATREDHVMERDDKPRRASSDEAARYYSRYAIKMELSKNFVCDTEIVRVSNLEKKYKESCSQLSVSSSSPSPLLSPASPPLTTCQSGTRNGVMTTHEWEEFTDLCLLISDSEDCGVYCQESKRCQGGGKAKKHKWYLRGVQKSIDGVRDKKISVFATKIVLACGVGGDLRRLGVPGEDASFLTHQFPVFAERIRGYADSGPVLVVGEGLSAADAVLLALKKRVKVVHVFHHDPFEPRLIFNHIPESAYPDYNRVFKLMQGKEKDPNYVRCALSQVCEFQSNGFSVSKKNGLKEMWCDVSLGAVLIGTDANLDFLPETLVPKLGLSNEMPISAKHNPINMNQFSFVTEASSSIYAIGSIAGDNFVRFCVGSALGAARHIITHHLS